MLHMTVIAARVHVLSMSYFLGDIVAGGYLQNMTVLSVAFCRVSTSIELCVHRDAAASMGPQPVNSGKVLIVAPFFLTFLGLGFRRR